MSDIQTSTIRVPKNVLEDIKIYCRKAGQPVGEWVEKAWFFLQKNDFDIYDTEATPSLPVLAQVEKERNQVDALCKLMSKFILHKLFGNIVYRAEFHAFHGGINFGVVGHNDEGLHLSLLSHPAQKVYATAVRQTQVGNHDIIICCLLQMFLRG